jgi:sporulation related protein
MAKDNTPDLEEGGAEQKNVKQRLLLLVLLLLVAVFGYLYFFTGMIKPREEAAKPELPQAVQVKKPLPPRPAEGETETKQPAGKQEPPAAKVAAAAKPVPAPADADRPQTEGGATTKQEKAKATPPAKAAGPAKTAAPKAQPVAGKKTEEPVATKSAEQKPAAAPTKTEKPAATAAAAKKKEQKPEARAGAEQEGVKIAAAKARPTHKGTTKGKFTLLIGDFVPNKTFLALEAKLTKQGVKPLGKTRLQKPEPMNRLFVAAYGDYESAAAELEKLKKLTNDAFYIENAGKYTLYAGSYYDMALVENERKRLAGKGYKIEVQKVAVPVSVVRLTAGSFSAKEDAERVAASLKKQGVTASVITQAK